MEHVLFEPSDESLCHEDDAISNECPVCFENLETRIITSPPCRHKLCLQCLLRLRAPRRCPMCRVDLSTLFPTDSIIVTSALQTPHINSSNITSAPTPIPRPPSHFIRDSQRPSVEIHDTDALIQLLDRVRTSVPPTVVVEDETSPRPTRRQSDRQTRSSIAQRGMSSRSLDSTSLFLSA